VTHAAFDPRPIGVLDSGVGGLTVLAELRAQLASEDVLYFADQGHLPYGPRPKAEIQGFVCEIVRFFLRHDAKAVVLACNAASAAALHHVRREFGHVPFVGMEPAVKPAAERSQSRVIGVLTTQATFQGELFASVVDQYAQDVRVATQICPALVTLAEALELDTPHARAVTRGYLQPLLAAGIDQLVLGCTHFPILLPLLREIAGPQVAIVDPSAAVARQAGRVIEARRNAPEHQGSVQYFTSGEPAPLCRLVRHLLGEPAPAITALRWQDGPTPRLPA
jgi:glutamate racemase